ncbi:MAG: J domain-containing protein, partial [Chloroflexota bacterium]|nr:J domain-containing protein [Chloroflexota bacterium]
MDTPDNYYATLGVPIDADNETLKRAYRQLARRYHPDLAGPEGAIQMKRINRAYDVLSDSEKRLNYDTIIGGVIDFRKGGLTRARPVARKFEAADDLEFSGLSIFTTKGPWKAGATLHASIGVISAVNSVQGEHENAIAGASLDGKGLIWHLDQRGTEPIAFASNPAFTVESLRELRFSQTGNLLGGWGRLGLHVWDAHSGSLLWSYALNHRAVSAHYSLDMLLTASTQGQAAILALPLLKDDPKAPRAWGVRGTDVVSHSLGSAEDALSKPLACAEDEIERRQFWAIRLRSLSQDAQTLLTLSCATVGTEAQQMMIIRRWNLAAKTRIGKQYHPQITSSIQAGRCDDCTPPYTVTPNASMLAYVHMGQKIRIYNTQSGVYNEIASGAMGGSARLAISPDAQWLAVAREDSEINEGVVDLWSISTGELVQKFYHPW